MEAEDIKCTLSTEDKIKLIDEVLKRVKEELLKSNND